MNIEIREIIWKRDGNKCRDCGRVLVNIIDEYKETKILLSDPLCIPIYKFIRKCWKCNMDTPIITYCYDTHVGLITIGSVDKLDKLLMEKYSSIKTKYSRTMEQDVIANICINCGVLLGNYFVHDELLDDIADEMEFSNNIIDKIEILLSPEDLSIDNDGSFIFSEQESFGHVHHIDHDRDNNNLDNLILLCRDCHIKRHKNDRRIGSDHDMDCKIFKKKGINRNINKRWKC